MTLAFSLRPGMVWGLVLLLTAQSAMGHGCFAAWPQPQGANTCDVATMGRYNVSTVGPEFATGADLPVRPCAPWPERKPHLPRPPVANAGLPWIAQVPGGGSRVAPVRPAVRHESVPAQAARRLELELAERKGDRGGEPGEAGDLGPGDGGGGRGGDEGGGGGGGSTSCSDAQVIRPAGRWMAAGGLVALFVGTFGFIGTYPGDTPPVNDTAALTEYNDRQLTSQAFAVTGVAGVVMFCAGLVWAMVCPLRCCR